MPDTGELPDRGPANADRSRERSLLARKWAYRLLSTVFVPLSQQDLERELLDLFDTVRAVVSSEPFTTQPAYDAGVRLVELGCSADPVLPCTMEVLGKGLLSWPGCRPDRVVLGLGALASGFSTAGRQSVLSQQEDMNLSLLKAVRNAKWHLAASEARFDEVVMASASGIMITDVDGRLVRVNAAVGDMLGYTVSELTGGGLFDFVHPTYARVLREDYAALLEGAKDRVKQPQVLLCRNGDLARVTLTATLLRGADERPSQFVTVVEDGTELLLLRGELNRQALHDALTGLPNRQYFGTHVERALRRADPEHGVTLFHLDLDSFAMICNGLGWRVGERMLVEAGRRLAAVMAGEQAMVARFDSDEFGILVENSATTPSVATTVANINAELAEPIYSDGTGVAMSASIGVVHRPEPHMEVADLLRAADVTLRKVKATGRAQWSLFHPDQDERDRSTYTLAAAMPGAFEDGEISVGYRPVARLADGRIDGVAALPRWQRPGSPMLSERPCVELADMTGLTLALGDWLLRAASRDTQWWRRRFPGQLSLLVGLTPHQSSDADLVSRVVAALEETGLPPERLTLLLPARAFSLPEVVDNLRVLADVGVRTGLDDFGTAPAELALVEDLPVSSVRLAHDLVTRAGAHSLLTDAVRTVVSLVHRAGVTVVIDGADTRPTADWWLSMGADIGTGELFGTPCSADDIPTVLGLRATE